jgi:hypothetical protein
MTCIALCLDDFMDDLHIIFEAAGIARYDIQFHISISISHDLHDIYLSQFLNYPEFLYFWFSIVLYFSRQIKTTVDFPNWDLQRYSYDT